MLHIENFVTAVREGRSSDAIKEFKAYLSEHQDEVKGELKTQVAEEFGMKKKAKDDEDEDESEEDDEDEKVEESAMAPYTVSFKGKSVEVKAASHFQAKGYAMEELGAKDSDRDEMKSVIGKKKD